MIRRGSYFTVFVMLAFLFTLGGQLQPASAKDEPAPRYRTITVTTTKDDITKNGNCTLREAMQAANTNKTVDRCPAGSSSGTDVIKLGRGIYVISITGRNEHTNKKGDIDITQSVKIIGAGRSSTIIDGRKIDRVFENRSTKATVTIQDLTIRNGLAYPPNNDLVDQGGAIANLGKMYITRVRFTNNVVDGGGDDGAHGGAIYSTGELTVYDSQFEQNRSGTGGALGISGILKADKCTFKKNSAYMAGAISIERDGSKVDITNSRFEANSHGPGSASAILQLSNSTTNISKSTFEKHGGDEVIDNFGNLNIRDSTFRNNSDSRIIKIWQGTVTVRYSTFQDNTGNHAFYITGGSLSFTHSTEKNSSGGVLIEGGKLVLDRMTFNDNSGPTLEMSGGEARIHNSTITGLKGTNSAVEISGGKLAIDMATIADNVTGMGGSLVVTGGAVTIHNTILANTKSQTDGAKAADCKVAAGTTTSLGYNLISRTDGCGLEAKTGDQFGTLANPIDPKLDVLKNHGGYNYTRALLSGSPAIDKAYPVNYFKTDQRVYKRPAGAHCDIGAYERGAVK